MSNNLQFVVQADYSPKGDQIQAISQLAQGLQALQQHQVLLGVTGSGKTFTIAKLIEQVQRPTLILAPNKTLAAQLYSEMRGFFPQNAVEYFVSYYDYYQPEAYVPASDTYIEKDAAVNQHIEQMRLSATKAMLERPDAIIVATVSAIYGLGDPEWYLRMVLHLVRGERLQTRSSEHSEQSYQRVIIRRLTELQYTRNDILLQRATYRVRGDIIDVYPAESERDAIRIELFDDVIEQLSYFDPLTGKILRQTQRVTIYPTSHYATPRQIILQAIDKIKIELQQRLNQLEMADKLVAAQRLSQRTQFDLEMLAELGYCSGIENYSRYLAGRQPGEPPPTLFDYLPAEALLIIDESHVTIPQIGSMYKGDYARKRNLVDYGFRLPSALDNRPLQFAEFERLMPATIYVSATPGPYELERAEQIVEQVVRPTGLLDPEIEVRPVTNQVDDIWSEILLRIKLDQRVLITTLTKKMAEDLSNYLSEQGIKVRYLHSDIDTVERVEIIRDLRLGKFDVLVGINLLREGLDLPEVSLVAIFDADKTGFLRSERAIIQTIGRAARNLHGKAILYADKITPAMAGAIGETQRRRAKQIQYNQEHNIIPQGIKKQVVDILQLENKIMQQDKLIPVVDYKQINQLEQQMYHHAQNLEFEQAAKLRDIIQQLKTQLC